MTDSNDNNIAQLPLNEGVRLLAHNEDGLVALDKPVGAMSHPNTAEENHRALLTVDYDLESECYHWTDSDGHARKVWLINRLDSPTSGVILLGLNAEISQLIKGEFASHRVTKTYYALVRGTPEKPAGAWSDKLSKDVHCGKRVIKKARFVSAKARYQMVKSPTGGFPVTLLKLFPLTGRTHQLRVQCKQHKLPIVGDRSYGNFSFNREVAEHTAVKRMLLHSAETIVRYSYRGKVREFRAESELPEDFQEVIRYRPGLNHGKVPSPVLARRRFKL
ncbi:MAG: RNA pseudouridine synthase [Puniceicoccaceae bacterium]|nr:MAG: RNA pseudouridine synthase [Puniceicoccaceae bacterium]